MEFEEQPVEGLRPRDITERFYDRTGPGTPGGRYLRRFWTPVAVLDDVKPGRAKRIQIMSEPFTYYRGRAERRTCSRTNVRTGTHRSRQPGSSAETA